MLVDDDPTGSVFTGSNEREELPSGVEDICGPSELVTGASEGDEMLGEIELRIGNPVELVARGSETGTSLGAEGICVGDPSDMVEESEWETLLKGLYI